MICPCILAGVSILFLMASSRFLQSVSHKITLHTIGKIELVLIYIYIYLHLLNIDIHRYRLYEQREGKEILRTLRKVSVIYLYVSLSLSLYIYIYVDLFPQSSLYYVYKI